MREFKRRLHQYALHLPEWNHEIEWLALMQHHGAPTRLLDWTYSLHVAVYFGAEAGANAGGDGAVWMMNATWSHQVTQDLFRGVRDAETLGYLAAPARDYNSQAFFSQAFMADPVVACVWPANPFRLNERLTLQKGVFTTVGDVNRPFVENLAQLPGWDNRGNLVKFRLRAATLPNVLDELFQMNVTRTTLFPGLDGFARSLDINLSSIPLGA